MKKIFVISAFAAFCMPVNAAPVVLECTMAKGDGGGIATWNISLDEAASTVSYAIPEMDVVNKLPAVFTADKVTFSSMEIDRIDLSFKRTVNIAGKVKTDIGKCKKADIAKRQF